MFMHQNEDIGFLIKLIHDSVEKKTNYELKKLNITLSQGRILAYLHDHMGVKTSQKDIEEYFDVTHPTVIGILKRLENKGLITSEFDDEDKRVKNIYLTQKEESIHQKMSGFQKEMEQRLLNGLTVDQVAELKLQLKTIYSNIQD